MTLNDASTRMHTTCATQAWRRTSLLLPLLGFACNGGPLVQPHRTGI
jgi:hypothetical protein